MDSLLERIEENTLDALYLFINETLRDRTEFDRFFISLMNVLPHNWSIQRVEVGHEFLTMVNQENQIILFETIASLEAIKTLIISDGYVPRKDKGSIHTEALLSALPRARNLINLDLHRLTLNDNEQVHMLADVLESMQESLEEIRMTGLFLSSNIANLDPAIAACVDMSHLRSLAMTCIERTPTTTTTTSSSSSNNNNSPSTNGNNTIISCQSLLELFQHSTSLQDLSLRAMNVTDETCCTIAKALRNNLFLTSLDLRQNPKIGQDGCRMILEALERNYDLWCTVMVDNDSFQGRFNSLIELNQANRGDLIRNPTSEKLITFLEKLKDDPTAVWYFLTIHDTVLYPFIYYLKWKSFKDQQNKERREQKQLQDEERNIKGPASSTNDVGDNDDYENTNMIPTTAILSSTTSNELQHQQQLQTTISSNTTVTLPSSVGQTSLLSASSMLDPSSFSNPSPKRRKLSSEPVRNNEDDDDYDDDSDSDDDSTADPTTIAQPLVAYSRSAPLRMSLEEEVAAILAQHQREHRQQMSSHAEMVDKMDSRAVQAEVQAILAQQRQQRLI